MIQIINGFKINSENPVDSRIIVDDEATRLAILYKYHGLRVWQTDTNTPYFWDGTDWKSELDLVVTGDGNVTEGYVPYFSDSDPVKIGDSIISVTPDLVTINGDLSFDSITSGSIDAGLINTGTMSVSRLQKGSDGQILQTVGTVVQWKNLSDLTIGNSTNSVNSNNLKIKTINLSDTYQLVLRNVSSTISAGGNYIDLFSHVNGLKFKDGGNGLRILAHNGDVDTPPYSFDSSLKTGMYSPGTNQIGFSITGQQVVRITSSYINFGLSSTGTPIIKNNSGSVGSPSYTWYSNSNTGMYSPATNEIGFSIAGQQTVRITSSYINFGLSSTGTPIIKNNSGNNSTPSYTWYGDSDTGMYRIDPNIIGFSTNGTERVRIDNFGRVKIANTDSKNTTLSISKGSNTNTLEVDSTLIVNDTTLTINGRSQIYDQTIFESFEIFLTETSDGVNDVIGWSTSLANAGSDTFTGKVAFSQLSTQITTNLSSSVNTQSARNWDRRVTWRFSGGDDTDPTFPNPKLAYIFCETVPSSDNYIIVSSIRNKDDQSLVGNSVTAVIPAGCRWKLLCGGKRSTVDSSKHVRGKLIIQKLGRGYELI
jgi:hypothetical protein